MLLYFSATLFVSATLLFLVQPMIGKMILPQLGGTPGVWNTCMVFFQGVLLVGYGYTHILTTTQPTKRQVMIHCALLVSPFVFFVLPFSLGDWQPPLDSNPVYQLMVKLTIMVGLPFMAVSTTAPLLQKWFVHTDDPAAKDPYFLYGASNFGSLIGLAAYPTILEPWLPVSPGENESTLRSQVHLWTFGYALFIALVVGCAYVVWQKLTQKESAPTLATEPASAPAAEQKPVPAPVAATAITASKRRGAKLDVAAPAKMAAPAPEIDAVVADDNITLLRRLRWIGLAAAPSSLMLGLTTHLTTDIAPVTYFWIVPLTLYLLTFILVFARWPWVWTGTPHTVVMFLQPCALLFLVLKNIANLSPPTWGEFALHIGAFFTTTLMCHGELAKDRPSAKHLTEFFFWMSLGGVLGGLFNALFAPIFFQHGHWEYPAAMAFACMLRSNLVDTPQTLFWRDSTAEKPSIEGWVLDFVVPIALGFSAYGLVYLSDLGYHADVTRWYLIGVLLFVYFVGVNTFLFFGTGVFVVPGYVWRISVEAGARSHEELKEQLRQHRNLLLGIGGAVLLLCAFVFYKSYQFDFGLLLRRSYLLAILVVAVLALSLRPLRFGLAVAALFISVGVYDRARDSLVYEGRGFFGLLRVRDQSDAIAFHDGKNVLKYEGRTYRTLIHGGINHGRQIIKVFDAKAMEAFVKEEHRRPFNEELTNMPVDEKETLRQRREPITYFHERNGVAEVYYKLTWSSEQPPTAVTNMTGAADARMMAAMIGMGALENPALAMLANTQSEPPYAVLGLGTGILASYAKPYQVVDFYEIDPLVKDMSITKDYLPPWHKDRHTLTKLPEPTFYFLQDAQERWANLSVKLGDGRLVLKNEPNREKYYHIISLDAFSSDAIPIHLLTKEAVQLYLTKLADGGVLVFNTTNRYVRIEPVLATIAKELNLECLYCADWTNESHDHPDRFSADWVVLRPRTDETNWGNGGPPLAKRLLGERKLIRWNGTPFTLESRDVVRETQERWHEVKEPLAGPAWTDGYSNLMNPKVMPWLTESKWASYGLIGLGIAVVLLVVYALSQGFGAKSSSS